MKITGQWKRGKKIVKRQRRKNSAVDQPTKIVDLVFHAFAQRGR